MLSTKICRMKALTAMFVTSVVELTATGASAQLDHYYREIFPTTGNYERIFSKGDINGQHDWVGVENYAQVTSGPSGSAWSDHTGLTVTSRGTGFGFEPLAESSKFGDFPDTPTDDFYLTVPVIIMEDSRVSWFITPVNISQSTVLTRIQFEANGGLSVFVPDGFGGGSFEAVEGFTWELDTLYTVYIEFTHDGVLSLGINEMDVAVFQSAAFGVGIEAVHIETSNERIGSEMYIDEIHAREGFRDPDARLELSPPIPGLAGEVNTLEVARAQPGDTVWYIYGSIREYTSIPGCAGLGVNIRNPIIAGTTIADESGYAVFEGMVPTAAEGRRFLFQAVDEQDCKKSSLVKYRFPDSG